MSVVVEIAEAVKDELNGQTFSQEFEAVRAYSPIYDLKNMDDLHVTVVPRSKDTSQADRNRVDDRVAIDIAVQQKIPATDIAQADSLMALVEEIGDFFRMRRLTGYPAARWVEAQNSPIFSPAHIRKMGQFTSVLTLTYSVVR